MRYAAGTALFLLVPVAASAAGSGEGSYSFAASLVRMVGSLAVVLGLVYLATHLSRRWFPGGSGRPGRQSQIRVVETRHLAPKKSLLLVEVAGEYLLLSNGSDGLTLIKQIDMLEEIEVIEVFGTEPRKGAFQEKLEALLGRVQSHRLSPVVQRNG